MNEFFGNKRNRTAFDLTIIALILVFVAVIIFGLQRSNGQMVADETITVVETAVNEVSEEPTAEEEVVEEPTAEEEVEEPMAEEEAVEEPTAEEEAPEEPVAEEELIDGFISFHVGDQEMVDGQLKLIRWGDAFAIVGNEPDGDEYRISISAVHEAVVSRDDVIETFIFDATVWGGYGNSDPIYVCGNSNELLECIANELEKAEADDNTSIVTNTEIIFSEEVTNTNSITITKTVTSTCTNVPTGQARILLSEGGIGTSNFIYVGADSQDVQITSDDKEIVVLWDYTLVENGCNKIPFQVPYHSGAMELTVKVNGVSVQNFNFQAPHQKFGVEGHQIDAP